MYIFVKIHDNDNGIGNKPLIIETRDLESALNTICEKYYGVKFTSMMAVVHYPIFCNVLKTIKEL